MKKNLCVACLLTLGLVLTSMEITRTDTSATGLVPVKAASSGPTFQGLPSVGTLDNVHSSPAIMFATTTTVYLPLLASACHLPPGLPSNVTMTWRDAALYAGPGNVGYSVLAQLNACTTVSANALYGEFLRVEVSVAGRTTEGFLRKSSLLSVPINLPILNLNQVPWQNVDFSNRLGLHPDVILQGADVIVDNSSHKYYNDDLPLSLTLDAGFELAFQISTSNGQYGSIKLADKQNNSSGDWWSGIRRVDFATYDGQLKIDLHDGISESSSSTIALGLPDNQSIKVTCLDPFGKIFLVLDQNGREIRRVDVTQLPAVSLSQGLFPQRTVYFGRVAPPYAQLIIISPSLRLAPTGTWIQPPAVVIEPTLRQLGEERGISTGTDFNRWLMQDPRYWDVMFSVYNTVILSDFSSTTFWRGRGDYDFVPLDRTVDWAIKNGFRVRASHLVWGAVESRAVPDWILNGQFSRDEYIQILHEHITTVVSHYKDRVTEWSIANEATGRSFGGNDFWAEKIGPEYIEMAFRWAREADPAATLIFNDDNNQSLYDPSTQPVAQRMLDTVRSLKAKGVPLDVVGMQMHLLLPWNSQTPPVKEDVIRTMQEFASLGVWIYITEFDVNLQNITGTQDERWRFEAQIYKDMVSACLESGVCKSFSTWGVSDANSWLTCTDDWWCVKLPNADPLMFDRGYQPKPAFWAAYETFASLIRPGSR
jgi:endo-1,4-beta-xylanase